MSGLGFGVQGLGFGVRGLRIYGFIGGSVGFLQHSCHIQELGVPSPKL